MSKLGDTILSAIDDGARNHAAIVDATGFDARQVSNQLFILKQSGAVVKGPDGYMRSDGTVGPKPTVHESAPAESSPPPCGTEENAKGEAARNKAAQGGEARQSAHRKASCENATRQADSRGRRSNRVPAVRGLRRTVASRFSRSRGDAGALALGCRQ